MKNLFFALLFCLSITLSGQVHADKKGVTLKLRNSNQKELFLRNDDDDDDGGVAAAKKLACPKGTVKAGEFIANIEGVTAGFQSSDQGRSDMPTKFYQSFSNNYWKVSKLRILADFQSYNEEINFWEECEDRVGIAKDGKTEKPIKLEVSFYQMDQDGKPGKMVHSDTINAMGRYTGIELIGSGRVYEYYLELSKDVSLESGFFSVSAIDTKEDVKCYFMVMTCSEVPGYSYILTNNGFEYDWHTMCYCMMGDGDFFAKKSIKLVSIENINRYSKDKYQPITVTIKNIGSDPITNPILQLWMDGEKLSEETLDITLKSLQSYTYTFSKRIDTRNPGEHIIKVVNLTPGDEGFSAKEKQVVVQSFKKGEYCVSKSGTNTMGHIESVSIGSIENTSKESVYTDYSDKNKTEITPDQALVLTVKYHSVSDYLPYIVSAYVDWNNNGSFTDDGELIGQGCKEGDDNVVKFTFKIPQNMNIQEGEKKMRIILSGDQVSPCSLYSYGETEDYTIVVKRKDGQPAISFAKNEYIEVLINDDTQNSSINIPIKNQGKSNLQCKVDVRYQLNEFPIVTRPNVINPDFEESDSEKIKFRIANLGCTSPLSTTEEDDIKYTLNYSKEIISAITPQGAKSGTFANLYPAKSMADLKNMKISSVDVHYDDVPKSNKIVIYTKDSEGILENVYEQTFLPNPNSWNRIHLDKSVEIKGDKSIIVGVEIAGFTDDQFVIGIDNGPGIRGYGDLFRDERGAWWTMKGLGGNYNFGIKTNLTGNNTPEINWVNINQKEFDIPSEGEKQISLDICTTGLNRQFYEADIVFTTNDALNPEYHLPIFLLLQKITNIETIDINDIKIQAISDRCINVSSENMIKKIVIYNMSGTVVKSINSENSSVDINLCNMKNEFYIMEIVDEKDKRSILKFTI